MDGVKHAPLIRELHSVQEQLQYQRDINEYVYSVDGWNAKLALARIFHNRQKSLYQPGLTDFFQR